MTYYVPGLGEKDQDKTIRSLMQVHENTATNTTNITANTTAIAANTAAIIANTTAIDAINASYVRSIDGKSGTFTSSTASGISSSTANVISIAQGSTAQFGAFKVDGLTITSSSGVLSTVQPLVSKVTNSTTANVALNNTANYFTGPTVANTTSGTWFASGVVTVTDTAGAAGVVAKLWDGTSVISSSVVRVDAASAVSNIHLSGYITNPAGNIRISCKDVTSTSGQILFNSSGESKDSTVSAILIG